MTTTAPTPVIVQAGRATPVEEPAIVAECYVPLGDVSLVLLYHTYIVETYRIYHLYDNLLLRRVVMLSTYWEIEKSSSGAGV